MAEIKAEVKEEPRKRGREADSQDSGRANKSQRSASDAVELIDLTEDD